MVVTQLIDPSPILLKEGFSCSAKWSPNFVRCLMLYRTTDLTVFFNNGSDAGSSLSKVFASHNRSHVHMSIKGKKPRFCNRWNLRWFLDVQK